MPSVTTAYMGHASSRMPSQASGPVSGLSSSVPEDYGIREVWAHNLEEEFRKIRRIVQDYKYVAMDTEFPGVVARPVGTFNSLSSWNYHSVFLNINMLKLIQVGLTFFNEKGQTPKPISTWQFNFKFSLDKEMFSQDSIDLLVQSGINFPKMEKDGIESFDFAALLVSSGLLLNDDVHWIAFHSGYDFAYLLRAIINRNLVIKSDNFYSELKKYFPNIWDLKYIARSIRTLKGGLQDIADTLHVTRRGPQHQAGSDSLLTGDVYFRLTAEYYESSKPPAVQQNIVYGLYDDAKNGVVDMNESLENVLNPDDDPNNKSILNGNHPHW